MCQAVAIPSILAVCVFQPASHMHVLHVCVHGHKGLLRSWSLG